MGEVGKEGTGRPWRRKARPSRKNALKDALPDVQPPGEIKASPDEEVVAENDEEDD